MLHTAQEGEKSREGVLWGGVWGEVRGLRVATSPWRPSRRYHSANGQRPTANNRRSHRIGAGRREGKAKGEGTRRGGASHWRKRVLISPSAAPIGPLSGSRTNENPPPLPELSIPQA